MAYKILLIEDDKRLSDVISRGLQKIGLEVEIAFDGQKGLEAGRQNNYDLILLDINIPYISGHQLAVLLREEHIETPIIFVSALGDIENKLEAFERGADDYICKPFDFRELVARIENLIKRTQGKTHSNIFVIYDLEIDLKNKIVKRASQIINLTVREFFLLEYLVKNKGRILSKTELLENVWELNFDTGTNIVEVYINYLRNKIDKNFSPKLIHTKPGQGYIFS
ncbi:response regulator transcription factor [Chryseobacterium taichungense]|uniref:response regulator transcription factor n=1 Tax=Chryseobacterium taichungense TaxID=295069 RepID=UPI0028ACE0CB|nr:response regulator transcription factor [Chryseobacterium taichungense]